MKNEPQSEAWGDIFATWSTAKRLSLALMVAAIAAIVLALFWWARHAPQAVLFADLTEGDAAVLTAELDKLKQPYSLGDDGRSIFVAADSVHRTRLALMGRQLPLHGVVGFELFNNADFGVSDFVQKVNYQRALQGELTRTILAIDQVQGARVHLALPDQAAFRKDGPKAKASVSVSLKGGQNLRADQVAGIQRLVAASVPEVKADDVTVLDQHGAVLSRAGGEDAQAGGQLDARQSLEAHLSKKAARLLDQMFGPGEAMVAVDVVLNHEQSRVTTEEVLAGLPADRGAHPAGIITRERTTTREPAGEATANGAAAQVLTQETDYQTGKRVAQTVSQGGQIAHLNAAVVVRRTLNEAESARVRQMVATAVGLQPARGDAVTVHSLSDLSLPAAASAVQDGPPALALPVPRVAGSADRNSTVWIAWGLAGLLGIALLLLGAMGWVRRQRRHQPEPTAAARLNEGEREALLYTLRQWVEPQS